MNLDGIRTLVATLPWAQAARHWIESKSSWRAAVRAGARPVLAAHAQQFATQPLLILCADRDQAHRFHQEMRSWSPRPENVLFYPELDYLPYENLPHFSSTLSARIAVLGALLAGQNASLPPGEYPVVVTSMRALFERLPSPHELSEHVLVLAPGQRTDPAALKNRLVRFGYEPMPQVEEAGTFTGRGGIVDIFPPSEDQPIRVEFFGDEIDSVRPFNVSTQRSTAQHAALSILPANEVPTWRSDEFAAAVRALDHSGLRPEVAEQWQRHLRLLDEGTYFEHASFYAIPFLDDNLLHYVPHGLVLMEDAAQLQDVAFALQAQTAERKSRLIAGGELSADWPEAYHSATALQEQLSTFAVLDVREQSVDTSDGLEVLPTFAGRPGRLAKGVAGFCDQGMRVVLATTQVERVTEILLEYDLAPNVVDDLTVPPAPGSVSVVPLSLAEGLHCEQAGLLLLSDAEIFGWKRPPTAAHVRPSVRGQRLLDELQVGDHVVHIDHGIGRFAGISRMPGPSGEREYLVLEFARDDRIYVPTDHMDRVEKYVGMGERVPSLSRLGTQEWQRAKQRAQQSVVDMAQDLVDVAVARESEPGHAFAEDSDWQRQLEQAFPYAETPDQEKAIADVKADMEQPRPTDRLICGDVGFGKTEVAIRAAFKAVADGKQVAVLVPTTVLALQHYETLSSRLRPFPVRVGLISRFRTPKDIQKHLKDLSAGTLDIAVGTHRLLSKDVDFKDLGLVIVDEEQRFGVAQKEHFKQLRKQVDVLALSATPIPRTLHMALAGIRDLSVIETPPPNRLAVKTYVTEFNDDLVKDAIQRELNRGGQVFLVHNDIETIYSLAYHIRELVPGAQVTVGHGQMESDRLEKVMHSFVQGEFDILVSTTIIENGLDIPRVNTLIVNDAWRFGLAQLYQLRGRVGRADVQAYSYFLYNPVKQLSEEAEKRLDAIMEATELGAGFKIALRDLEIRGAGNLLGAEQHGFVNAVGLNLYTKMLQQTVQSMLGEEPEEEMPPEQALGTVVDLPLAAYIPDEYVGGVGTKMRLYQRAAALKERDDTESFADELRDRFGPPPPSVENLLVLLRLRARAAENGILSVAFEEDVLVIRFREERVFDRMRLFKEFGTDVRLTRNVVRWQVGRQEEKWRDGLEALLEMLLESKVLVGTQG
jgi:transcription-repair coupling factor (superfamily II helicase)